MLILNLSYTRAVTENHYSNPIHLYMNFLLVRVSSERIIKVLRSRDRDVYLKIIMCSAAASNYESVSLSLPKLFFNIDLLSRCFSSEISARRLGESTSRKFTVNSALDLM